MIDYDLHIHTAYCGHAPPEMNVQAILQRSDDMGLKTIAITDHVFCEDDLAKIDTIRNEASEIESNCEVIIGAEVDVDATYWDGRLVTDKLDHLDYVIASLHYLPGVGIYPHSPADNPLGPELLFDRWKSSLMGLLTNPKVDTLAHPGRMIAASIDLDVWWPNILAVCAEAAKLSAKNNIAWEMNELTGYRLAEYWQQQWYKISKIALDAGVKLVYGSDAHVPSAIGLQDFTDYILEMLPPNAIAPVDQIIKKGRI